MFGDLWDHCDALALLLCPCDVGSVCTLDRSHAARAETLWHWIITAGPDRIVDQWFESWVPCDRLHLELVKLATYCREEIEETDVIAPSVVFFDELWGSKCRHWMSARSLDRVSLHAEHDLCDNHRRPFDCRKLRIGRRGKPLYRSLVFNALNRISTMYDHGDAMWLAYCMLGISNADDYAQRYTRSDNMKPLNKCAFCCSVRVVRGRRVLRRAFPANPLTQPCYPPLALNFTKPIFRVSANFVCGISRGTPVSAPSPIRTSTRRPTTCSCCSHGMTRSTKRFACSGPTVHWAANEQPSWCLPRPPAALNAPIQRVFQTIFHCLPCLLI